LVAGIAVVAIGGFAVWKFVIAPGSAPEVAAADHAAEPVAPPEAETPQDPTASGAGGTELLTPPEEGELAQTEAGAETPEAEGPANPEQDAPAASGAGKDPASVDLSIYPDFGKLAETSEEAWTELQELAATMVDPAAGAAGNRAKMKLQAAGKAAFPALLNIMKHLDVSVEQGFRDGDLIQKLLQDISNGRNFGWKYSVEDKDQYFNKRVIEEWCKSWTRCKDDEKFWNWFAKLDEEKPAEGASEDEEGAAEGGNKRLRALDELDD
jgi:hypothetical protein